MNVDELIQAAGGLDEEGSLRLPQVLWDLLEDAPRAFLFAADRKTVLGQIRMVPAGAAVYHVDGEGYSLLNPEELEDLLRSAPIAV
jgi:hypothetical protein